MTTTRRKSSLGYDWHPECLRCEECGKRLNPGQHAEHKGVPYCYIPCYGVLFGPQLYGHGSKVESHSSFGKKRNSEAKDTQQGIEKSLLEAKLKEYNVYCEAKVPSNVITCRERNDKLILEGSLRIYWDVSNKIHLKEENDDRIFVIRRKSSYTPKRNSHVAKKDNDKCSSSTSSSSSSSSSSPSSNNYERNYKTLPIGGLKAALNKYGKAYLNKSLDDEYITLKRPDDEKAKDETDNCSPNTLSVPESDPVVVESGVTLRKLKRSKARLRRRCSINGHYYNRETSIFTPDSGSVTSVWITSLVNTTEVINLLLEKFKVTNKPEDFALFIVYDNGECRRVQDYEYPLLTRVILGPNEDVSRVFIFNKNKVEVSSEVAQYLNLSNVELQMFLKKFEEEEMKEVERIKKRFDNAKQYMKLRIKELEKSKSTRVQ
ncbi:ras association domain-containing protein 2-like protein [Leptotrombidium deliense]|uniref:Ras association domain-containing protein 2-like protein n=1 Tax=Leptotrombidium deliense TaxID=299467 RepID=A0A443SF96_9ACAR|nr:ras association domain-containing protein 2-like protein [Leptotrombidium deliense]